MRAALALLGESLSGTGLTLACPAPAGGGMGADFRLDGSATLRFTAIDALVASGGGAALARLGGSMATARDALAAMRAGLDALVGLLALFSTAGAALAAAARGGSGAVAVLGAALVPAAYAALVPFRRALLRLVFRALMRAALRRAGSRIP